MDVVNEYFHRFYPACEVIDNREMEPLAGGYGLKCLVRDGKYIFPLIICKDGFTMSVQGHFGAYSYPRDDYASEYKSVEILLESGTPCELVDIEPLIAEWNNGDKDEHISDWFVVGYVPVDLVCKVIEKHGGINANASIESKK